jgi:hypothetical protein
LIQLNFESRCSHDFREERGSFNDSRHHHENSPLEKNDVLRPIHSVAGGEFGGADEEDAVALVAE